MASGVLMEGCPFLGTSSKSNAVRLSAAIAPQSGALTVPAQAEADQRLAAADRRADRHDHPHPIRATIGAGRRYPENMNKGTIDVHWTHDTDLGRRRGRMDGD